MTTLIEELVTELADLPPLETLSPREEVTLLLERIVAKYGRDYVYTHVENAWASGPGCVYARIDQHVERQDDGGVIETVVYEPSCILGHLLYVKDSSYLEKIVRMDNADTSGEHYNQWGWGPMASEGVGFMPDSWAEDTDLVSCLCNLQRQQDEGMSWGEALDSFKLDLAECSPA